MINARPAAVTNAKTTFIHAECFIPIKFTNDNPPINKIAEIVIGISINSAKYPPNPNETVAAVIIEVIAVSHPMINPINLLLNACFTKVYSAAALGNSAVSSA